MVLLMIANTPRARGRLDVHFGEQDGEPGPKGCDAAGSAAQAGHLEAGVDGDGVYGVELVGALDLGEHLGGAKSLASRPRGVSSQAGQEP